MNKPKFVSLMAALSMLMLAGQALAHPGGSNQPSPDLPPVIPDQYMTPADVHARYSGPALELVLSFIEHTPFAGQTTPGPDGERHHMDSTLTGQGNCQGAACPVTGDFPVNMIGPVDTIAYGRSPGQLGTFDTEMLQMNLSMGPVMIRESPTKASTGKTTITLIGPPGPNQYHIDSFFDVFTELSLDGTNWIPSNVGSDGESHPTRVFLGGVPEPASAALLAMGLIGGAGLFRRRR